MAALTLSDLAAGTYTFAAVASDNAGASSSSLPMTVTVTPAIGLSVINFDALNTAAGSVGGVALSNYLSDPFWSDLQQCDLRNGAGGGQCQSGDGKCRGWLRRRRPIISPRPGLNQPVSFHPALPLAAASIWIYPGGVGGGHRRGVASTVDGDRL